MQLELFKNETLSEYYKIDKIDVVDIYDPAKQYYPLLNQIQRGDYFLYKTGYTHPALYLYGDVFPSLYSNLTKRFVQPHIRKDEYVHYGFTCSVTKKLHYHLMHRLVGCAFIVNDNPSIKKIINHKNNQNHDFRISNLEWASYKENISTQNVNKGNRILIRNKLRERHEIEMKKEQDA